MILTHQETIDFLTKADLENLNKRFQSESVQAPLEGPHRTAVVTVRKKQVPLFTVLELLGKL